MAEFKHSGSGTAFNMGLATLDRINNLLNMASEHSIAGEYYQWFNTLYTLKRDVFPFLPKEAVEELNKILATITNDCWQSGKNKVLLNSDSSINVPEALDKLDTKLRGAMKEAGLLMPKSSDPRFSWAMEA